MFSWNHVRSCQIFVRFLSDVCQILSDVCQIFDIFLSDLVRCLSDFCQMFVRSCQMFVRCLSDVCQIFVRYLSDVCQIFVRSCQILSRVFVRLLSEVVRYIQMFLRFCQIYLSCYCQMLSDVCGMFVRFHQTMSGICRILSSHVTWYRIHVWHIYTNYARWFQIMWGTCHIPVRLNHIISGTSLRYQYKFCQVLSDSARYLSDSVRLCQIHVWDIISTDSVRWCHILGDYVICWQIRFCM